MHPRRLTAAAAAGLALVALAGCRTSPNVAAYVGEEQVTVAEFESAVESRLADPAVATAAEADRQAYEDRVLTQLIEDEVHTRAAQRYGVEVGDSDVQDRIRVLLGDDDPAQVFGQLATQGVSRADVSSSVRQQLIRLRIAEQEGLDEALSDEALQARYDQTVGDATQLDLGFITVPDQAAADQVVAALEADPGRYGELAQQFPGDFTLPAPRPFAPEEVPGPLAQQAAAAEPGTAFSVPVQEAGGIVVGFVAPAPSFEELRPQLEQQATTEVDEAASALVDDVREDLDIETNPRYGTFEEGRVQPLGDGLVEILPSEG